MTTTAHMLAVARDTVAAFPAPFADLARDVVIQVIDQAPPDILAEMECHPLDLTGLYDGVPLTEKSFADQPHGPDTVWLYRLAILDEHATRGNVALDDLIAHVTVHEFAHHFGWSDDDIAAIDRWWE